VPFLPGFELPGVIAEMPGVMHRPYDAESGMAVPEALVVDTGVFTVKAGFAGSVPLLASFVPSSSVFVPVIRSYLAPLFALRVPLFSVFVPVIHNIQRLIRIIRIRSLQG
jgi:hypothetical protein